MSDGDPSGADVSDTPSAKANWSAMTLALREAVQSEAIQWYAVSEAPLYVKQLTCYECVEIVLHGVRCVLSELGLPPELLESTPLSDLAAYWAELFRSLFAQVTIWSPADLSGSTEELIRKISSGIYHMSHGRLRHRALLLKGSPVGAAEFPLYVNKDAQKMFAVSNDRWQKPGKSWAQYATSIAHMPRRKQVLRSSQHAPDDILDPRAFAGGSLL